MGVTLNLFVLKRLNWALFPKCTYYIYIIGIEYVIRGIEKKIKGAAHFGTIRD
jgi:hypothetical protein